MISVHTGANLVIKGNGTVTTGVHDDYAIEVRGGNIIVENGTFIGSVTAAYAMDGNITINGGIFNENANTQYGKDFILNLYGQGNGSITVKGGMFYGFNPQNNVAENPKKNFVAEGYSSVADGDWYIVVPGNVQVDAVAHDATELTALLSDASVSAIGLPANATIEGTFTVNRAVSICSIDANNKATIKGRINVSDPNRIDYIPSFTNIKFAINDASKHKNTFSGAPYQYPAIVVAYGAAMSFEGCEFETSLSAGVCGINAGNHADSSDLLTVNNCTFKGDFYAIRTRTLFSITNNTFDIYTNQGTLAAVWTWGNANSGATKVTFTGNTNTNANKIYGVQMIASNFVYDYITINVQENINFHALADGVNPVRFNGTHTFAEGSETF